MKKMPTEYDMRKIGISLSTQLEAAMDAWELSMTCYRINSREYKAICRAGQKTQEAYKHMMLQAERMWDDEEVRKYFTVNKRCTFN